MLCALTAKWQVLGMAAHSMPGELFSFPSLHNARIALSASTGLPFHGTESEVLPFPSQTSFISSTESPDSQALVYSLRFAEAHQLPFFTFFCCIISVMNHGFKQQRFEPLSCRTLTRAAECCIRPLCPVPARNHRE